MIVAISVHNCNYQQLCVEKSCVTNSYFDGSEVIMYLLSANFIYIKPILGTLKGSKPGDIWSFLLLYKIINFFFSQIIVSQVSCRCPH